jgi:hypothetical protein
VVTKQYVDSILGSIGDSGGYVAKSGDTMTGSLTISEPGPSSDLILSASSHLGTSNNISGQTLGVARWTLSIGNYKIELAIMLAATLRFQGMTMLEDT